MVLRLKGARVLTLALTDEPCDVWDLLHRRRRERSTERAGRKLVITEIG